MMREMETWLSDSRVGNNSVVEHRSQMSCLTILGVEMQAVEVDAQRHQRTQANLNELRWLEADCELPRR